VRELRSAPSSPSRMCSRCKRDNLSPSAAVIAIAIVIVSTLPLHRARCAICSCMSLDVKKVKEEESGCQDLEDLPDDDCAYV
jgi:hypothetical protein